MEGIKFNITIKSSPKKIYEAILNQKDLQSWWTTNCRADPVIDGLNKFDFKPNEKDGGFCITRNIELVPSKLIKWKCEIGLMGAQTEEWNNTIIEFNIEEKNSNENQLKFHHKGLTKDCNCYNGCKEGWEYYIKTSLKNYLETGKGDPYEG